MNNSRFPKLPRWLWRVAAAVLIVGLVTSCSPYASVSIGVPFNAGPFWVNPSIGVGTFL